MKNLVSILFEENKHLKEMFIASLERDVFVLKTNDTN